MTEEARTAQREPVSREARLEEALREAYEFTKGFSGRKVDKLNKKLEALLPEIAGQANKGGV